MSPRTKKSEPKKEPQKDYRWSITRIRGTPAVFLGYAYGPDQETALDRAAEQFQVRPELRDRLIARRDG
jgi:hypothetical protein